MNLLARIKGAWNMLIGRANIENALKINIIRDAELESAQQIWQQMLEGRATWNTKDVPSLHLASSICREISNNATFELEAELTGNDRLQEQFNAAIEQMPEIVSGLAGNGSLVLKPFVRGDKIMLTIAAPDRFFPLKYNEVGDLISVAFADRMNTAKDYYTLLETHAWDEPTSTYNIEYRAFHSRQQNDLGKPVAITSVPAWAHLEDIEWKNIIQPLFIELNMPNKEAIFAKAVDLIRLADEQYGRAAWEYEGGELAIDATIDLFRKNDKGKPVLPKGKERLFRVLEGGNIEKDTLKAFSPALRDTNLFNGLNEHKRAIEFACGLAYGTISDPNMQDKTATEIRSTKQRFLITVRTIQKLIEEGYTKLSESMNILGQLYSLFPAGNYEVSFVWGDSVMEDPDVEYQRRKELVAMGLLKPEALLAWYFSITEEEAAKIVPAQQAQSME